MVRRMSLGLRRQSVSVDGALTAFRNARSRSKCFDLAAIVLARDATADTTRVPPAQA
jgi:hypothetical protein